MSNDVEISRPCACTFQSPRHITNTSKIVTNGEDMRLELSIAACTKDEKRLRLMAFETLRAAGRKQFDIECMTQDEVEDALEVIETGMKPCKPAPPVKPTFKDWTS